MQDERCKMQDGRWMIRTGCDVCMICVNLWNLWMAFKIDEEM